MTKDSEFRFTFVSLVFLHNTNYNCVPCPLPPKQLLTSKKTTHFGTIWFWCWTANGQQFQLDGMHERCTLTPICVGSHQRCSIIWCHRQLRYVMDVYVRRDVISRNSEVSLGQPSWTLVNILKVWYNDVNGDKPWVWSISLKIHGQYYDTRTLKPQNFKSLLPAITRSFPA